MTMHPSPMETFDLDEREYNNDVAADLRRSYLPIGPVRVHKHEKTDPACNILQLQALMARKYWKSADAGADELWPDVREWVRSKGYFVGATIKNFNKSRGERGDQTVDYGRLDLVMGPVTFQVAMAGNTFPALDEIVGEFRAKLNEGVLGEAAQYVVAIPSAQSLAAQREAFAAAQKSYEELCAQKAEEAGAAAEEGEQAEQAAAAEEQAAAVEEQAAAENEPAADGEQAKEQAAAAEDVPEAPTFQIDYTEWGISADGAEPRAFDSAAGTWR